MADFIQNEVEFPPVLVGHSFGGLIVQYYIANMARKNAEGNGNMHPYLAGSVLVCSVPPSVDWYGDISSPNLLLHIR